MEFLKEHQAKIWWGLGIVAVVYVVWFLVTV